MLSSVHNHLLTLAPLLPPGPLHGGGGHHGALVGRLGVLPHLDEHPLLARQGRAASSPAARTL